MSKQNRESNRRARAAALVAQQKRAERNRRLTVAGGVVLLLVVVVAVGVWFGLRGSSEETSAKTPPAKVEGTSLVVGPDSAPTKATVWEDFQCPFCREFESSSRAFLREASADGRVQVTYKPISILNQDDYSARALSAWEAVLTKGTPVQALDFHDELYEHQPYENASTKPGTDQLRSWAKDAGVDKAAVLDAIGPVDTSYVKQVTQAAVAAQVRQTPTVEVDGTALTGATMSQLTDQLEAAVRRG